MSEEAKESLVDVVVGGGKYRYVQRRGGGSYCLRHGEPWRDCTGDGLILALAQVASQASDLADSARRLLDSLPRHWHDDAVSELRDIVEEFGRG